MPGGSVNGRPFREAADSYNNTGIPCGNPKRYHSSEVVRMGGKTPSSKCLIGPVEDIETEGDRQLQVLLKKQLDTSLTIQQHFKLHKKFSDPVSYKPATDSLTGAVTRIEYQDISDLDNYILELKQCGLTEEEIQLKLSFDDSNTINKKPKVNLHPEVHQTKLDEIDRKITAKRIQLDQPDRFSGVKKMGRHEMDLERAISHNRDGTKSLTCLLTQESRDGHLENNHGNRQDPLEDLPEILHHVMERAWPEGKRERRKRKRREKLEEKLAKDNNHQSPAESIDHLKQEWMPVAPKSYINSHTVGPVYGPHQRVDNSTGDGSVNLPKSSAVVDSDSGARCLHGDVISIPEEEIVKNRLSLEEIRQEERFHNYTSGEISKTLYVKNLSPKVTEQDLAGLFIRFQQAGHPPINFKLMTGRMKGQAFVTFDCEKTATKALELVNGYMYKGKPVIVQYGKKQTKQAGQ